MVRARQPEPDPPSTGPVRKMNIDRLREGLAAIPKWKETHDSRPPEFQVWQSRTLQSLGAVFGKAHDYYTTFNRLMFCVPGVSWAGGPSWSADDTEAFDRDIERAERILKDALEEVDVLEAAGSKGTPQPTPTKKGNDVFIVHGHDETNLYRLRDL